MVLWPNGVLTRFNKPHRHGTDGQGAGQGVSHKRPSNRGMLRIVCILLLLITIIIEAQSYCKALCDVAVMSVNR